MSPALSAFLLIERLTFIRAKPRTGQKPAVSVRQKDTAIVRGQLLIRDHDYRHPAPSGALSEP